MEPVFISEPNTPMKLKNNYENEINEVPPKGINDYPNEYNYIINNNLGYPFRTKIKLESLNIPFETSPNYNKNIMKNKLKYSLRTYSIYKHSFVGDIFFESDKAAFLLLINVNTRYAYAYQLGKVDTKEIINIDNDNKEYIYKYATNGRKTTKEIIKAFDEHLLNHPINILRFDGEKAINSNKFKQHFKDKFKIIPAISEAHSSLSLIDRLCRTIRDIAFNLNIEAIYSQEIMNLVLNYYNNSRHETLTKIIFKSHPELKKIYKKGILPSIMESDEELEKIYVEECMKYNFNIVTQPGFKLKQNDIVKIKNDDNIFSSGPNKLNKRSVINKDDYIINNQYGNIYELINTRTNERVFKPRYEIFTNN
jgi:hypothetical protein